MKQDFKVLFSSRTFLVLLFFAACTRLSMVFFFLPASPSNFGPDEGTYGALATWVSEGKAAQDFPVYGAGLYNSSRSITLPGAFLINLGIEELTSVRLVSLAYGLLSIISLGLCVVTYQLNGKSDIATMEYLKRPRFILLLALYSFFPSYLLWSTLGLRESASQFWIITSLYFFIKTVLATGLKSAGLSLLLIFSMVLTFGARPETALVFAVTIFAFSVLFFVRMKKIIPILAIAIGFVAGQAFITTPVIVEVSDSEKVTSINPLDSVRDQILTVKILEYKRNVNRIDASSALPESQCQNLTRDAVDIIQCNLRELPYRLFAFLLRPLPMFDGGSKALQLAGFENLVWAILLAMMSWSLKSIKKLNTSARLITVGLTSYLLLFSSAAALYEGNLGTAFRHKSTILWTVVFILYISPISERLNRISFARRHHT